MNEVNHALEYRMAQQRVIQPEPPFEWNPPPVLPPRPVKVWRRKSAHLYAGSPEHRSYRLSQSQGERATRKAALRAALYGYAEGDVEVTLALATLRSRWDGTDWLHLIGIAIRAAFALALAAVIVWGVWP